MIPLVSHSNREQTHRALRRGGTLLEVLIAISIFVAGWASIGQLLSVGLKAAQRTKMSTEAMLRCESKAAELMLDPTIRPGTMRGQWQDRWQWTAIIRDQSDRLLAVDVSVSHPKGTRQSLSYWMRKRTSP